MPIESIVAIALGLALMPVAAWFEGRAIEEGAKARWGALAALAKDEYARRRRTKAKPLDPAGGKESE
jgi:hypothetical protein